MPWHSRDSGSVDRHPKSLCTSKTLERRPKAACIKRKHPYLARVNATHRKTLAAVFTDPVSGTLEWAAIERLLLAAGARLIEGRGSRVRFEKDGEVATFHRPHPAKDAKRYQVRDARDFLIRIGVIP
jgi:hypothetical protein